MSLSVTLLLVGVLGSANDATVQFQQNGKCLAADGFYLKSALTMQDCGAASSSTWIDGPDAKGNPQIASYFALLHAKNLCLNDDSVSCTEGTKLWLTPCQQPGDKAHITVANHWKYDADSQQIVSLFCNTNATKLCVATHGDNVALGKCTDEGAHGWTRVPVAAPPSPSKPTLPPLPPVPPKGVCKDCPNIVFVLTDDQDQLIGGSLPAALGQTPLPKAKALLMDKGAYAENFFIHTPICCPSRAETLTGRYLHNVKLPVAEKQCGGSYAGSDAFGNTCCMHIDEYLVNNNTMAMYLKQQAGYRTGMFGKYLNNCPNTAQPGFDAWYANGGGTYYSPQFAVQNIDGLPDGIKNYGANDYSTALIGNYSIAWIKKVANDGSGLPWMAFIGTKACHDPFQPAPWYKDYWAADWPEGAPRPPSYNVSKDQLKYHHPTISNRTPFNEGTASCIDQNFKNRWRTLMSVDDIIEEAVAVVEEANQMDNTYFVYSSDHGYSFGELNLAWDKRNVYEFDVRIHLVMRGPGIVAGSHFAQLASNVDIAPTFLSLAGLETPPTMDGKSMLPLLVDSEAATAAPAAPATDVNSNGGGGDGAVPGSVARYLQSHSSLAARDSWRTSHYIEYYYVGIGGGCGVSYPIENPDNNFIALRKVNATTGVNTLYAEFMTGTDGNVPFDAIEHYEYFDMAKDPWQLKNVYNSTTADAKAAMHKEVHAWLGCKGAACP